jgi:hypothetical protein
MLTLIHECQCDACQQFTDHMDWQLHHQMNVLVQPYTIVDN